MVPSAPPPPGGLPRRLSAAQGMARKLSPLHSGHIFSSFSEFLDKWAWPWNSSLHRLSEAPLNTPRDKGRGPWTPTNPLLLWSNSLLPSHLPRPHNPGRILRAWEPSGEPENWAASGPPQAPLAVNRKLSFPTQQAGSDPSPWAKSSRKPAGPSKGVTLGQRFGEPVASSS